MTTLSYEKAKELKDAGFPQNGKGELHLNKRNMLPVSFSGKEEYTPGEGITIDKMLYFPILSELIEACGDKVRFHLYGTHERWEAEYRMSDEFSSAYNGYRASGTTPEEAVAHLWIALQQK